MTYSTLHKEVSVIGSFPLISDSPEENARLWLGVQEKAEVNYPCLQNLYGMGMVEMFLTDKNVEGFLREGDRYFIDGSSFFLVRGPVQHKYLDTLETVAEKTGYKPGGWTFPVTGPFTLAENIRIRGRETPLINDRENRQLIEALAYDVVAPIARYYSRRAAHKEIKGIVRVDEPVADGGRLTGDGPGQYGFDSDFVREVWDNILGVIDKDSNVPAMHVCGDIGSISVVLSQLKNVRLLSHDFSGKRREQLQFYRPGDLEKNGVVLGVGLVSSDGSERPDVESYEEAESIYREACNRFGKEGVHLHPSCGFGSFMKTSGLSKEETVKRIHEKLSVLDKLRREA